MALGIVAVGGMCGTFSQLFDQLPAAVHGESGDVAAPDVVVVGVLTHAGWVRRRFG